MKNIFYPISPIFMSHSTPSTGIIPPSGRHRKYSLTGDLSLSVSLIHASRYFIFFKSSKFGHLSESPKTSSNSAKHLNNIVKIKYFEKKN